MIDSAICPESVRMTAEDRDRIKKGMDKLRRRFKRRMAWQAFCDRVFGGHLKFIRVAK